MTTGQLTIAELQQRYGITRNPLYDRLKAINMKLKREGKKSVASPDQIKELDDLDSHLKKGGTLKNYTSVGELVDIEYSTVQDSSTLQYKENNSTSEALAAGQDSTVHQDSTVQLLLAVAQMAANQRSPLWWQAELEKARVSKWLLTTKEVQQLIGVKPKVSKGKKIYKRGCWIFKKTGKIGSQIAWRVYKEEV